MLVNLEGTLEDVLRCINFSASLDDANLSYTDMKAVVFDHYRERTKLNYNKIVEDYTVRTNENLHLTEHEKTSPFAFKKLLKPKKAKEIDLTPIVSKNVIVGH